MVFAPGTIKQVYEKLLRIRAALQDQESPIQTPMELLARIEPLLAQPYRKTFAPDHVTPESRFAALETNYEETKDPVLKQLHREFTFRGQTHAPQSVLRESMPMDLRKAIQHNRLCTPQYMMEHELQHIQSYYEKIRRLHDELQRGELTTWLKPEWLPYEREQILKRVDFKAIEPEKQKSLLQSLSDFSGWHTLPLAYASALTDAVLISLVKQHSLELHALDISYCTAITPKAINKVLIACPNLRVLCLAGLPQLIRLESSLFKDSPSPVTSIFRSAKLLGTRLQLLDIRDCTQLEEIVGLYLPQLQTLITEDCKALKKIDIQALRLKAIRKKNCPVLTNCVEDNIGIFKEDKEILTCLEQLAKDGDEDAVYNLSLSKNRYALMGMKFGKPIEKLLRLVAEGEQDIAEKIIKLNPQLLLQTGTVKDLSDREFKNITPFQYALWAMDWHMWKMIRKYLSATAQAEQFNTLENKGTEHGIHYDIKPLIEALQTYVGNHKGWSDDEYARVTGVKWLAAHRNYYPRMS